MGTFAGRPLCDPRAELDNCLRLNYPTDWASKANSFTCPLGTESGRGYVLMLRGDLDDLAHTPLTDPLRASPCDQLNAPHDLTLVDAAGVRTFKSLHVARTTCLTPAHPGDRLAVHLVELGDPRRVVRLRGSTPGNLNTRVTPTGNYAIGATPYTWTEALATIWFRVFGGVDPRNPYGTVPSLPAVPDGTPEGLAYDGWRPLDALRDFLARLGLLLRWNPFTDVFDLVQPGATQADLADLEQANRPLRLFDIEPVATAYGSVPVGVSVYFRNQGGSEDGYGGTSFTSVLVSDTNRISGQYGTDIIHDDLPALYQGSTQTNAADLTARATARATEYFRIRKKFQGAESRKVYSGFLSDFLPGSQVGSVTWRSLAGGPWGPAGPTTVVDLTPLDPDPFAGWRAGGGGRPGLPPVPWFRGGLIGPQSSGTAAPSGYDDYALHVWTPLTDAKVKITDAWRVSVESDQLAHVHGVKSSRPVFATACDTPASLWNVAPATSLASGSNNVGTFTLDRTGVWLVTGTMVLTVTGVGAPDTFSLVLTPTSGTIFFANASTVSWTESLGGGTAAGTMTVKVTVLLRVRVAAAGVQVAVTRAGVGYATATFTSGNFYGVNLG